MDLGPQLADAHVLADADVGERVPYRDLQLDTGAPILDSNVATNTRINIYTPFLKEE